MLCDRHLFSFTGNSYCLYRLSCSSLPLLFTWIAVIWRALWACGGCNKTGSKHRPTTVEIWEWTWELANVCWRLAKTSTANSLPKMRMIGGLKEDSSACWTVWLRVGVGQRAGDCLSTLKLNLMQDYTRRKESTGCWELDRPSGTGMMLKTLLITSLLGWAKCQESQSMTLEEKTVIRWDMSRQTYDNTVHEWCEGVIVQASAPFLCHHLVKLIHFPPFL